MKQTDNKHLLLEAARGSRGYLNKKKRHIGGKKTIKMEATPEFSYSDMLMKMIVVLY